MRRTLIVLSMSIVLPAMALAQAKPVGAREERAATARTAAEAQADDAAARSRQGYRFFRGRWRLPQEIAYLQRASGSAAPAATTRLAAEPKAMERPAAAPGLRRKGRRGTPVLGILSLGLQSVRLQGMDTVTVGFGNGTGRLQLPRTETISFGGTVAVPMGVR